MNNDHDISKELEKIGNACKALVERDGANAPEVIDIMRAMGDIALDHSAILLEMVGLVIDAMK